MMLQSYIPLPIQASTSDGLFDYDDCLDLYDHLDANSGRRMFLDGIDGCHPYDQPSLSGCASLYDR